jgi:WD repeat-containing protein 42A
MPSASGRTLSEIVRTRDSLRYGRIARVWTDDIVSSFGKRFNLERHTGCINSLAWNESGTKLISGSDDRSVVIWREPMFEDVVTIPTGHRNNVFCATFVPNSGDEKIVTCAADGCVHLLDVESGEREVLYESAFTGYCFKHCVDPEASATSGLVSISDGSVVRYDIRSKNASEVLNVRQDPILRQLSQGRFTAPPSATALLFNPVDPFMLALGTSTKAVLLYDVRNMSVCGSKIIPQFTKRPPESFPGETEAVSGIDWDKRNGLIVNYCRQSVVEIDAGLVLWNCSEPVTYRVGKCAEIPRQWTGRVNHQTFLKEVALLGDGKYVATGGDCGSLFVWSRFEGQRLLVKKPADPYVLNCVAPNPILPLIATSGIARIADIWDIFTSSPSNLEEEWSESETDSERVPLVLRAEVSVEEARERLRRANILRAEGNEEYRASNFLASLARYIEALELLEFHCPESEPSLTRQRRETLEKCHTNKAAALMGLSRWTEAIDACDDALDLNPSSHRALVRRSKCYLRLGHLESALEDVERVLLVNPTDGEALSLFDELQIRIDRQDGD